MTVKRETAPARTPLNTEALISDLSDVVQTLDEWMACNVTEAQSEALDTLHRQTRGRS